MSTNQQDMREVAIPAKVLEFGVKAQTQISGGGKPMKRIFMMNPENSPRGQYQDWLESGLSDDAHGSQFENDDSKAPRSPSIDFHARGYDYTLEDIPEKNYDRIPPPVFTHGDPNLTEIQEALGQYYCYHGFFLYPFRDGIERPVFYPTCSWGESCPWVKRMCTPHIPFYRWGFGARQVLADRHAFLGEKAAAIDAYFSGGGDRQP